MTTKKTEGKARGTSSRAVRAVDANVAAPAKEDGSASATVGPRTNEATNRLTGVGTTRANDAVALREMLDNVDYNLNDLARAHVRVFNAIEHLVPRNEYNTFGRTANYINPDEPKEGDEVAEDGPEGLGTLNTLAESLLQLYIKARNIYRANQALVNTPLYISHTLTAATDKEEVLSYDQMVNMYAEEGGVIFVINRLESVLKAMDTSGIARRLTYVAYRDIDDFEEPELPHASEANDIVAALQCLRDRSDSLTNNLNYIADRVLAF